MTLLNHCHLHPNSILYCLLILHHQEPFNHYFNFNLQDFELIDLNYFCFKGWNGVLLHFGHHKF